MAGEVDRDAFVAMLAARYPAVTADIDECMHGFLHLEMGQLAKAVQAAISDEDSSAAGLFSPRRRQPCPSFIECRFEPGKAI